MNPYMILARNHHRKDPLDILLSRWAYRLVHVGEQLVAGSIDFLHLAYRRRKAVAELRSLSDRLLADIGISRSDIPSIVNDMLREPADTAKPLASVRLGEMPSAHNANDDTPRAAA